MTTLGIDFGTSNSACGVLVNGRPHLIEIEPGEKTLPTSVFFDVDSKRMLIGSAADRALIAGAEGRFMRELKSVLGTALMRERRMILGESLDFIDIVARFLARLRIPEHPPTHSDNMRPPVSEDPPTCDALPRGSVFWVSDPGRFVSHSGDGFSHGLPLQPDAVCVVE